MNALFARLLEHEINETGIYRLNTRVYRFRKEFTSIFTLLVIYINIVMKCVPSFCILHFKLKQNT